MRIFEQPVSRVAKIEDPCAIRTSPKARKPSTLGSWRYGRLGPLRYVGGLKLRRQEHGGGSLIFVQDLDGNQAERCWVKYFTPHLFAFTGIYGPRYFRPFEVQGDG
jgi:hypothetical protein